MQFPIDGNPRVNAPNIRDILDEPPLTEEQAKLLLVNRIRAGVENWLDASWCDAGNPDQTALDHVSVMDYEYVLAGISRDFEWFDDTTMVAGGAGSQRTYREFAEGHKSAVIAYLAREAPETLLTASDLAQLSDGQWDALWDGEVDDVSAYRGKYEPTQEEWEQFRSGKATFFELSRDARAVAHIDPGNDPWTEASVKREFIDVRRNGKPDNNFTVLVDDSVVESLPQHRNRHSQQ